MATLPNFASLESDPHRVGEAPRESHSLKLGIRSTAAPHTIGKA
jgi:hypothetical protein